VNILKSRRFLTLLMDTVISLSMFFIAKYLNGGMEDVKFVIMTLQPVFIALIAAYGVEDFQIARNARA